MKFVAEINVMPLKALLDPQGRAVALSLHKIGYKSVENVQIGKHIVLEIEAQNKESAEEKVDEACKKILSNPVIESYEFKLVELN